MSSERLQRWRDEFAADHDGRSPYEQIWHESHEWDRIHANAAELAEREDDLDQLDRAVALWEAGQPSQAIGIWRELADRGSTWSMLELGRCYEFGAGLPADPDHAEQWYKLALAGGSQEAMLKCASAAASRGEFAACEAILRSGIDQDWTPALFWMAWHRQVQSADKATYRAIFPLLKTAAQRGHPAARFFLVNFMSRGKFGIGRIPLGWSRAVQFAIEDVRRKP